MPFKQLKFVRNNFIKNTAYLIKIISQIIKLNHKLLKTMIINYNN